MKNETLMRQLFSYICYLVLDREHNKIINKSYAGVRDVAPPDLQHHPAHVRADVPQHFHLQEIE